MRIMISPERCMEFTRFRKETKLAYEPSSLGSSWKAMATDWATPRRMLSLNAAPIARPSVTLWIPSPMMIIQPITGTHEEICVNQDWTKALTSAFLRLIFLRLDEKTRLSREELESILNERMQSFVEQQTVRSRDQHIPDFSGFDNWWRRSTSFQWHKSRRQLVVNWIVVLSAISLIRMLTQDKNQQLPQIERNFWPLVVGLWRGIPMRLIGRSFVFVDTECDDLWWSRRVRDKHRSWINDLRQVSVQTCCSQIVLPRPVKRKRRWNIYRTVFSSMEKRGHRLRRTC